MRGSAWTMGGYGAAVVLRLASNLLLTRLLLPEAFGVAGLVAIFIAGLQMFSQVGVGTSIIRSPRGDDPTFLDTAWTIQVIRGLGLWGCTFLIAWPLSRFYGVPELTWLVPLAGLGAAVQGFESTSIQTHVRSMKLARTTLLELTYPLTTLAAMAALAVGVTRPGAWVLVTGGLLGVAVRTGLSHVVLDRRPHRFHWDRGAAAELFGFGKWIFASTALIFLATQADRLILGRLVPMSDLGVYSIAVMLAQLPRDAILRLSGQVAYPVVSRTWQRGGDPWRLRSLHLRMMLGSGLVCAGFMASIPAAVALLYDDRYTAAGPLAALLAVGGWFQAISASYNNVLMASGSAKHNAAGMAVKLAAFLVLAWPAFGRFGLPGIAAAAATSELGATLICALGASRLGVASIRVDATLTAAVLSAGLLAGRLIDRMDDVAGVRGVGLAVLATATSVCVAAAIYHLRSVHPAASSPSEEIAL